MAGGLSPGRRPDSLASAALATYGTNVAVAALSLANVLVVAWALGVQGRGEIAFLIAITWLAGHLASLGTHEANANLGAAEPALRPVLAGNSLVLATVLGTVAAGIVLALVAWFPAVGGGADHALLWLAAGAIPVMILRLLLQFLLQADYHFGVTNLAWLAGPLTTSTLNALLGVLGVLTVGIAFGIWIVGQLIGVVVMARAIRRTVGFARPSRAVARRSLGFGLRTHAGRFMEVGNTRLDQWLLGAMVGPHELGLYSVAVAWAELMFYVSGVIVLVQRPDLVRASREHAVELATRVLRRALPLAAAAGGTLVLLAPVLCAGLFGEEFRGSVDDLRVLACGALGILTLDLLANALIAQRRPLLAAAALGTAFTATVGLDLLLIPPLGGLGAAIATATAYTAGAVAAVVIFLRALGGGPADLVPRPADLGWYWRKARLIGGGLSRGHAT